MKALASTTSRATCEGCGAVHETAQPTPSFRCEHCISAEADAAAARTRRRALAFIGAGALLLVVAALIWSTGRDFTVGGGYADEMPLAVWVGVAAVGLAGIGFGMLRFRPKLQL